MNAGAVEISVPLTANTVLQAPEPGFRVLQTSPEVITFHRIEDHELELLTNMSRPIALALAGTTTGAFFGLLPVTVSAFGGESRSNLDLLYVGLCFAAFALGAVFWPVAVRAQIKATGTLKRIRNRPTSVV